jgi:hypothetical protein
MYFPKTWRPLKNVQFCSSSRKTKVLTAGARRKCPWSAYFEYFEDRAKAPLRAKC